MAYRDDHANGIVDRSWKQAGWLLWTECDRCEWQSFDRYVTERDITSWRVGPWARMT